MNNTNKFLFDLNNFDTPDQEEVIIEEEIETEPPPPSFNEDELEAAKAVAHASGRNEGIQEERGRRDQQIADTLKKISDDFSSLFAAEIFREKQFEEESLKLALQIIDALAPSLQTRLGQEALKNALQDVLKSQSEQSEIKVEVHPESASDIDKMLDDIWPDKESAPRYKVLANSELQIGACALSWKDGGMVRDPQKLSNDIKTAIEALLVEQVIENPNSSLTGTKNNGINDKEHSDSSENASNPTIEDQPNGDKNDE